MKKQTMMTGALVTALLLGGCGGEELPDSAANIPPAAEGLWTGSLELAPAKSASLLVLKNGSLWLVYTKPGSTDVGGVMQATGGSPNGNTYTATAAREFNLESIPGPSTLNLGSTSLVAASKFWGNFSYSSPTVFSFKTTYNANNLTSLPAIVATLSGTTGSKAGLNISSTEAMTNLTIDTTAGTVTGVSASACTVSGSIAPLSGAKAYTVNLNFSGVGSVCANSTAVAGVAFFDANSKLNILALNSARTNGFVFRQN